MSLLPLRSCDPAALSSQQQHRHRGHATMLHSDLGPSTAALGSSPSKIKVPYQAKEFWPHAKHRHMEQQPEQQPSGSLYYCCSRSQQRPAAVIVSA